MESVVNQTTVGKELTHFGVIVFADNPQTVFNLGDYTSKREVIQAIRDLKKPNGNTYTGKALTHSLEHFKEEHGGRADLQVPQILMLITDGSATNPNNLQGPATTLRDNRISVFAIGVKDANEKELELIAGGDSSKVFYVDNFKALENLYRNISEVLCESTKPGTKQGFSFSTEVTNILLCPFSEGDGLDGSQFLATNTSICLYLSQSTDV